MARGFPIVRDTDIENEIAIALIAQNCQIRLAMPRDPNRSKFLEGSVLAMMSFRRGDTDLRKSRQTHYFPLE